MTTFLVFFLLSIRCWLIWLFLICKQKFELFKQKLRQTWKCFSFYICNEKISNNCFKMHQIILPSIVFNSIQCFWLYNVMKFFNRNDTLCMISVELIYNACRYIQCLQIFLFNESRFRNFQQTKYHADKLQTNWKLGKKIWENNS